MFGKKATYQNATFEAGMGGLNVALDSEEYEEKFSFDAFVAFAGPLIYPALVARAKAKREETQT